MPHPVSILIVDDKPHNIVALEAALASVACDLVVATSGRDALQCVLAQDFAVIVLDIQMPIMDGFETASLIRERERSRATPIIFLTAYDPDGLRIPDGYRLGAVDYIYTPVDPYVLRSKVSAFVELFREAVAREARTAELNQLAADELLDANGRIVVAGVKAEAQAELHIALTAYELRRPAMDVKASAQRALQALADPAPDRDQIVLGYLENIIGGADRLLSLTDNLTDAAGPQPQPQPQPQPRESTSP